MDYWLRYELRIETDSVQIEREYTWSIFFFFFLIILLSPITYYGSTHCYGDTPCSRTVRNRGTADSWKTHKWTLPACRQDPWCSLINKWRVLISSDLSRFSSTSHALGHYNFLDFREIKFLRSYGEGRSTFRSFRSVVVNGALCVKSWRWFFLLIDALGALNLLLSRSQLLSVRRLGFSSPFRSFPRSILSHVCPYVPSQCDRAKEESGCSLADAVMYIRCW